MKPKVSLLDKTLLSNYYNVLSVISVIASFIFLVWDIPQYAKVPLGIGMAVLFAAIYIIMWIAANTKKKTTLCINHSTVEICEGDLFASDGFKVIAFNEYFDTQVDDVVISSRSLNGQYIRTIVSDVQKLDADMASDQHLRDCMLEETDRPVGKKIKYVLGTIYKNDDYFLTAFSRFDHSNRAYLDINDYINCLMNFWNECDIHYAGQSVSMTLLGSGITRFRGNENITEQELLELIIWTFMMSKIRFQDPFRVRILLTKELLGKINLYILKKRFSN